MSKFQNDFENLGKESDDAVVDYLRGLTYEQIKEARDFLIQLLSSDYSTYVKNAVACALRDLGDDRAVFPLLAAAKDSRNAGNIGTFLYALQTLNCNEIIPDLTNFLIESNNGEVMEMAYQALATVEKPNINNLKAEIEKIEKQLDFEKYRIGFFENALKKLKSF